MPKKSDPPAVKGSGVRFIHGKYKGYEGWLNSAVKFPKSSKNVYVIVNMDGIEKVTYVRNTSLKKKEHAPSTRWEAALQQYPTMEAHLSSLCRMMAECQFEHIDQAMGELWIKELAAANKTLKKKGVVAYRKVDFQEMNTA